RKQFAKMPPVPEHYVAHHDEGPFVSQHLKGEVDRAARAVSLRVLQFSRQSHSPETGCKIRSVHLPCNQLQNAITLRRPTPPRESNDRAGNRMRRAQWPSLSSQ